MHDDTLPTPSTSPLAAALAYAARGWPVHPLHDVSSGECSCGEDCGTDAGKHPRVAGWQKAASTDPAVIRAWWSTWPNANVAVATGHGLFVLDIDGAEGLDTLSALLGADGAAGAWLDEQSLLQMTPHGQHVLFEGDGPNTAGARGRGLGAGLDTRGTGGYIVVAPSYVPDGEYEFVGSRPGGQPSWLVEHFAERPAPARPASAPDGSAPVASSGYGSAALASARADLSAAPDGSRNHALNEHAFRLGTIGAHGAVTEDEAREALWQGWQACGAAGYADGETSFTKTFASGWSSGLANPREPWPPAERAPLPRVGFAGPLRELAGRSWPARSWDDFGNAERLVDHYGEELRWLTEAKSWSAYSGGRWTREAPTVGTARMMSTFEALPATEAAAYPGTAGDADSTRGKFLAFTRKIRTTARVSAALDLARPALAARLVDFDREPYLLNTRGGVVDLRDGSVASHSAAQMMTLQAPVDLDLEAKAPRWQAFLDRCMPGDEWQNYLRRVVGYSLTAETGEQAMFVHHGEGANGKSVFLSILSGVLGDYAQTVPRASLMAKRESGGIPNDVARMVGKRLLLTTETAKGGKLDEELVKQLTGGEPMSARFMRGEFFDFTPTGKIHLATNHRPGISDAMSIWRRLHLFAWSVIIPEDERDKRLAATILADEAAGVLAWCVRGAIEWYANGLERPLAAQMALAAYRDEEDVFGQFLAEALMPAPDHYETTAALYLAYQRWAVESGFAWSMTRPLFGKALAERGFTSKRRHGGERGFVGLRPVSDVDRAAWRSFGDG